MEADSKDPRFQDRRLKLLGFLFGASGLAIIALGTLTLVGVFETGTKLRIIEIGGGILGIELAYWVRRLARRRPAGWTLNDSAHVSSTGDKRTGLLMSGRRWIVLVAVIGAASGYAFTRDVGIALIGGIAGAVV